MILLLLFGLFAKCISFPFSNGTSHELGDTANFRVEAMFLKPTETNSKFNERANYKPCHNVLCADGRCVSHYWLCRDTDVGFDDALHNGDSDDMRKRRFLFNYGIGVFAVIMIVIVVLVCICAIEDKEYDERNFNYRRRTSKKFIYPYSRLENSFKCPCDMCSPCKSSEMSQKIETVPEVKIVHVDEKC